MTDDSYDEVGIAAGAAGSPKREDFLKLIDEPFKIALAGNGTNLNQTMAQGIAAGEQLRDIAVRMLAVLEDPVALRSAVEKIPIQTPGAVRRWRRIGGVVVVLGVLVLWWCVVAILTGVFVSSGSVTWPILTSGFGIAVGTGVLVLWLVQTLQCAPRLEAALRWAAWAGGTAASAAAMAWALYVMQYPLWGLMICAVLAAAAVALGGVLGMWPLRSPTEELDTLLAEVRAHARRLEELGSRVEDSLIEQRRGLERERLEMLHQRRNERLKAARSYTLGQTWASGGSGRRGKPTPGSP